MRKLFLYIILIIILALGIFYPKITSEKDIDEKELILYFTGDIMLDRGVLSYMEINNDYRWPFLNIVDDLKSADLVFGNLESMISDKGHDTGSKYSFRAPPSTIEGLVYAGFDVLSVANNHSFDYSIESFTDSLNRLKEKNILYTGGGFNKQEAHSPTIKQINDTKIGFLAYTNVGSSLWQATENNPGISWIDKSLLNVLENDIKLAKKESDILVVSFHFGQEYEKEPDENQKLLAHTALNAGADIIVGHHPHVVQPLEKTEKGIIAYSLGNFIFDQYFSQDTMTGAILKVVIENKQIIKAELIKTQLNYGYQVEIVK